MHSQLSRTVFIVPPAPPSLSDRYRRSYDSEFTAPLVMYHVWPALVEGNAVIVKGEALTSRGAPVLTYHCFRNIIITTSVGL